MANISDLIDQLVPDKGKLYLFKNRDLIAQDNFTVLQNDNGSTKIEIVMPITIGGKTIGGAEEPFESYNFYIDYIDGAGKPGVVENTTEITALYKQEAGEDTYTEVVNLPTVVGDHFTLEEEDIYFSDIENNQFSIGTTKYIVETNVQYVTDEKNYNSRIKNENFEDSAEISKDYGNPYSDALYIIKSSANLSTGMPDDELQQYILSTWTLDKQVTNAIGEVTFSIRIEKPADHFIYQSNSATFKVTPNLKETYYLKKEIEENYVIQNRTIKPVGNFENILVKGDTNSNKIFYKMNRYYQGQDILAPKKYEGEDVYKNQNGVFFKTNNDDPAAATLGITYTINDLQIYTTGVVGSYDELTNSFTIGENTYHIQHLAKEPQDSTIKTYKYFLYYTINSSTTVIAKRLDSLDTTIELEDGVTYSINIAALGSAYESSGYDGITTPHTYPTKGSGDELVPVYNRLIRFVFMSPNKDYGDWNNGEIEYIDPEGKYFIFSWTPDYRVTRSEGDVSYYIEFFINGSYEDVIDNTDVVTVRTKSYSWSTLPTTIRVESNVAATASVNYIPHWVSYLENGLQDDLNAFLHSDLQSQYNDFAQYLTYAMLGDYSSYQSEKETEGTFVEIDNVTYKVIYTEDAANNQIEVTISNEEELYSTTFTLEELSAENIYGNAFQLSKSVEILRSFIVNEHIYTEQGTSNEYTFTIEGEGDNKKVQIIINSVTYQANYPDTTATTLTFSDIAEENQAEDIITATNVVFKTDLINDFYTVYNKVLDRFTFYKLENDNAITVPFLVYAQEMVSNWLIGANNQKTAQQTEFNTFLLNMVDAFGVDGRSTATEQIENLYNKIWDYFNVLGNQLQLAYNSTEAGTIVLHKHTIEGETNITLVPTADPTVLTATVDNQTYYFKQLRGKQNDIFGDYVEIETSNSGFYEANTYYYQTGDSTYTLDTNAYYTFGRTYFTDNAGTNQKDFYVKPCYINSEVTEYYGLSGNSTDLTYYISITTLYQYIEDQLARATASVNSQIQTSQQALQTDFEKYVGDLSDQADDLADTLETYYKDALSDFYITAEANANVGILQYTSDLKDEIDKIYSEMNERTTIPVSRNGILIFTAVKEGE